MTTFGIPAECGCLVEYASASDLETLYDQRKLSGDFLLIGGGSNLLFVNGSYPGMLLHCADTSIDWLHDSTDEPIMVCGAGVTLDDACCIAAERGLWGLENLSGIPGSVGGAAVQNAGAYGVEICDVVNYLEVFFNEEGEGCLHTMDCADCRYGYRSSIFKSPELKGRRIITEVAFRLRRNGKPMLSYTALGRHIEALDVAADAITPALLRQAVLSIRDGKLPHPAETGSAGSFFKNPVVTAGEYDAICRRSGMEPSGHRLDDGTIKLSAAWLIDKAGCKSFTVGGAALWPAQPLLLVNRGGATGRDVATLAERVIDTVDRRFGVRLSPEVIFVK